MKAIDKQQLDQLVEEGYVILQKHPTLPLYIYNYSQKTQYEKYWTPLTLMCRGLVLTASGVVVARGFDKFFNYEELKADEIPVELDYEVFEKYDGSYINVFKYNGELVVSSRGSFTSEHALFAEKLINEQYPKLHKLPAECSFMFELIADWNRIVCDYGKENKLVLLGGWLNHKTEYRYDLLSDWARFFECEVAVKYASEEFTLLKNNIKPNHEGYVVRFSNGFRMKIKGEEYVKLHKILTNITRKSVWEHYQDVEKWATYIELIPDEFMGEVKQIADELEKQFSDYLDLADKTLISILEAVSESKTDRGLFAKEATQHKDISALLFLLYDGRIDCLKKKIWKMIEPKSDKLFLK